jgi:hypothetical protein
MVVSFVTFVDRSFDRSVDRQEQLLGEAESVEKTRQAGEDAFLTSMREELQRLQQEQQKTREETQQQQQQEQEEEEEAVSSRDGGASASLQAKPPGLSSEQESEQESEEQMRRVQGELTLREEEEEDARRASARALQQRRDDITDLGDRLDYIAAQCRRQKDDAETARAAGGGAVVHAAERASEKVRQAAARGLLAKVVVRKQSRAIRLRAEVARDYQEATVAANSVKLARFSSLASELEANLQRCKDRHDKDAARAASTIGFHRKLLASAAEALSTASRKAAEAEATSQFVVQEAVRVRAEMRERKLVELKRKKAAAARVEKERQVGEGLKTLAVEATTAAQYAVANGYENAKELAQAAMSAREAATRHEHSFRELVEDGREGEEDAAADTAEAEETLETLQKEEGEARQQHAQASDHARNASLDLADAKHALDGHLAEEAARASKAQAEVSELDQKLRDLRRKMMVMSAKGAVAEQMKVLAMQLRAVADRAVAAAADCQEELHLARESEIQRQDRSMRACQRMVERIRELKLEEADARVEIELAAVAGLAAYGRIVESAAFRVEGLWRRRCARRLMRDLVKGCYVKFWDEEHGCYAYFNTNTKEFLDHKPMFLSPEDDILSEEQKEEMESRKLQVRTHSDSLSLYIYTSIY